MGQRDAKDTLFEHLARVGKAVGSGKRLELLDLLAQGERTVEALAQAAELALSTTSAHLQTLKRANLVSTRRDGTRIHYRLAGPDVAAFYLLLREVAAEHISDVADARDTYLGPDTDRVDREELLRRAQAGTVTVLDVRPAEEYRSGHIPGAVSIPLDELADRIGELPPDQEIVAYCRGAYCVFAHEAVRLLTARGRLASRLTEGMLEWGVAGLPVAS